MKTKNSPAMLEVFAAIAQERVRQRELLRAGKITFDVASTVPDDNRKLRVLVEEVGEVAEALDRMELLPPARIKKLTSDFAKHAKLTAHLREELVQVAAVAVAWLEALELKTKN